MKQRLSLALVAVFAPLGSALAAIPAEVDTAFAALEADATTLFTTVAPYVVAVLALTIVIKLIKRFGNKI